MFCKGIGCNGEQRPSSIDLFFFFIYTAQKMKTLLILFSFVCFAMAYDHNIYIDNVKRVKNLLPTGTVLAWWKKEDIPEDFIECDGRPVPEGTELRKLMSHTPNYVGKFLKGRNKEKGEKAGNEKPESLIIPELTEMDSFGRAVLIDPGAVIPRIANDTFRDVDNFSPFGSYIYANERLQGSQEIIFMTDAGTEIYINDLPTDIDGQTYSQSKQIHKKRTDFQNGKYITQLSMLVPGKVTEDQEYEFVNSVRNNHGTVNNQTTVTYDFSSTIPITLKDAANNSYTYSVKNIVKEHATKSKPKHLNVRYIIKL